MKPSEFHASRKFVTTSCGDIAYVERGSGPAALFIHGAPLCGYQWRSALESLHGIRRCIAPDSMGLGYSRVHAGQPLTPGAQVRMLAEFLDALSVDVADLVGNDSGGGIAQLFAATHPDRVRSLTLTNCEIGDYKTAVGDQFMEAVRSGAFTQAMRSWLADPRAAADVWAPAYEHPDELDPDDLRVSIEPLLSSPERIRLMETYLSSFDPKFTIEAARELKKLPIPVAIFWGLADTFFSVKDARWLRDELSSVKVFVEIEGAKLFFPEERATDFAALLRRFWQSIPASGDAAADRQS